MESSDLQNNTIGVKESSNSFHLTLINDGAGLSTFELNQSGEMFNYTEYDIHSSEVSDFNEVIVLSMIVSLKGSDEWLNISTWITGNPLISMEYVDGYVLYYGNVNYKTKHKN